MSIVSSQRPRVLVVDDEEEIRSIVEQLLNDAGYCVTTASGGREATSLLPHESFDLIIVDMVMPDVSGMDVLEAARGLDSHAKVIVMTGYPSLGTEVQLVALGVAEYVTKPFRAENLRAKVASVLRKDTGSLTPRAAGKDTREARLGRGWEARPKILVADDEEQLRVVLTHALTESGYSVTAVDDCRAAPELLESETFDLLIIDLAMPEMRGTAALRRVRELDPHLPVIVVTGDSSAESVQPLSDLGVHEWFFKPLSLDVIILKVARLLEARRTLAP